MGTKSSSTRETRKPKADLPEVPDLGHKITTPRKTNRSAIKTIASGDRFWDKRKVERKAHREAQARQGSTRNAHHRLSRRQKQWLLNHLEGWSWDGSSGALVAPRNLTDQQINNLATATSLPYMSRAVLYLQGLTPEQGRQLRAKAASSILLFHLDPATKSSTRLSR